MIRAFRFTDNVQRNSYVQVNKYVFNTVLPFLLKKRNNFKATRMACYIAKKNGKIVNLVIKSYLKTLNL